MRKTEPESHGIDSNIQRAVTTMLDLELRAGASPAELKRFAQRCVADAVSMHKPNKNGPIIWLYQIARVLRTWHLETRFLTPAGKPKALKTIGKDGLHTLIRMHFPASKARLVVSTMKRNGLVRRRKTGHWVPTQRYARTPRPTAELLSHFAEGVSKLAETVGKNIAQKRTADLLLEKAAQVSDLPRTEVKAFKKFVQSQGMAFLTSVDDWLESRARHMRVRKSERCSAGVFAFAFVDDEPRAKRAQGREDL